MGHELGLNGQAGVYPLSDRSVEMSGIPVNYNGGEEVEPGYAVVLVLAGAVTDFALASDPQRVLERVVSLALVQAGVGPALHIGVEEPVDDEERSFDPSDFTESDSQFVLARIGRELSQQLAGRKSAAGQGGRNPHHVRPVPHDHVLPYFVAGQSGQGFGNASGLEDMQPFRRQVPDARDEPVAEQGCDGEDMAGETAGVGVLLADAPPETDREALVALYNATDGPNWNGNDNWLSDVPISEWKGVSTDNDGGVIGLDLSGNQLSGEIPTELGKLTSLEYLDLSGNQLTGCVPSSLSGRLNMEYSELGGLQFCP